MTFEEALRTELITIEELNEKVFPLTAPEGTEAPYLIYVSSRGRHDKALEGFQKSKTVSVEINVIHDRASKMRALARQVKALIMGMEKRRIANEGPFIEEVIFENEGTELYEHEVDLYRCVFDLTFYFEEEE
jgi:hypothetical protein